ncbi:hypothetical protein [Vibrio phage CKB-S2]|nr:hypothetical protein [Vibrio phage CKB-S2]
MRELEFLVSTHNEEGLEAKKIPPYIVKAKSLKAAAESLGEIVVDGNEFKLVAKTEGKKHMRLVVSPVRCYCK